MLEEVGISVEFSHHETGPGQNEIDLRHADALQTADNVMTFRTVIKEVAYSRGMYAAFMPKPFTKCAGSRHAHPLLPLRRRHQRIFSSGCRIPAVQDHATSSPVCSSMPLNSPRSPTSSSTPTSASGAAAGDSLLRLWGHNSRSALCVCPCYKPNKMQDPHRIQYRGLDSASNPYLARGDLAAGLKGIENSTRSCPP